MMNWAQPYRAACDGPDRNYIGGEGLQVGVG